ncbi:MAG: XdhC family protein [Hymenobacteraceae bacterium]|nr:XdhC family protein [Hymenobacteraceae bacterium]
MDPLAFASVTLLRGQPCCLLLVVAHAGSTPGRTGFRMVVGSDSQMAGSIGGGIMEHKLVELARHQLRTGRPEVLLKRQIHVPDAPADRSGMICSGEQTVLLFPLEPARDAAALSLIVEGIRARKPGGFALTTEGFTSHLGAVLPGGRQFEPAPAPDSTSWRYTERYDPRPTVHIIGAGHVGLACCDVLSRLDFRLRLYDERPELNTLHQNTFADERIVAPFAELSRHVGPGGPDQYVAIMSFGYRTDAIALRQVLYKPLRFLGLLGSTSKVQRLFSDLRTEGVAPETLARVHAPIGLPIGSQTPAEIAISVAAQLVQVRNGGK